MGAVMAKKTWLTEKSTGKSQMHTILVQQRFFFLAFFAVFGKFYGYDPDWRLAL
jgi:hypothetical protein